jgi:hypothetical protein
VCSADHTDALLTRRRVRVPEIQQNQP